MNLSEYMNSIQAAAYLGVLPRQIYWLTSQGKIERQKIAGHNVYTAAQLDAYKATKKKPGRRRKVLDNL